MRKLGLSLSFLAAFSLSLIGWSLPTKAQVGPPNTIQCNGFAPFTGTGATTTFVSAKVGAIVAICGWHVTTSSATTVTFQFSYGSAANCGGGTNLTPALQLQASAPSADHVDFASLSTPANNNVCVNAPASVTGGLWYTYV